MKRILGALLVGGLLLGVVFAAAAALNVDAFELQAGSDEILICDEDGVQIYFRSGDTPSIQWDEVEKDFVVTGVVVAGLDSGCDHLMLTVVLTDENGDGIEEATMNPIVRTGTNPVVPVSPTLASDIYDVHVLLQK